MPKREWAATNSVPLLDVNYGPYTPEPPDGDGWRLVSAVTYTRFNTLSVVWYWEREVADGEQAH